jgi:hypothetical protein
MIVGGRQAEPLGAWTRSRARELGAQLDLLVIGGGNLAHTDDAAYAPLFRRSPDELVRMRPSGFFIEGLGGAVERRCPTAWHAIGVPADLDDAAAARVRAALMRRRVVTVRDEVSRRRLLATGLPRDVDVVPHPPVLADRLFEPEVLERRLRHLRALGQFPADGRPVVVAGGAALTPELVIALRQTGRDLVFINLTPCSTDDRSIDAALAHGGAAAHRLPAVAPAEDIVAAIATAAVYVGPDPDGAAVALAFGVPAVAPAGRPSEIAAAALAALAGREAPAHRAQLRSRADAHFDRLAELALEARAADAPRRPRVAASADGIAYKARSEQLLRERMLYEELLSEADAELADLRARLAAAEAERPDLPPPPPRRLRDGLSAALRRRFK